VAYFCCLFFLGFFFFFFFCLFLFIIIIINFFFFILSKLFLLLVVSVHTDVYIDVPDIIDISHMRSKGLQLGEELLPDGGMWSFWHFELPFKFCSTGIYLFVYLNCSYIFIYVYIPSLKFTPAHACMYIISLNIFLFI
jgi:hypothetical protein